MLLEMSVCSPDDDWSKAFISFFLPFFQALFFQLFIDLFIQFYVFSQFLFSVTFTSNPLSTPEEPLFHTCTYLVNGFGAPQNTDCLMSNIILYSTGYKALWKDKRFVCKEIRVV